MKRCQDETSRNKCIELLRTKKPQWLFCVLVVNNFLSHFSKNASFLSCGWFKVEKSTKNDIFKNLFLGFYHSFLNFPGLKLLGHDLYFCAIYFLSWHHLSYQVKFATKKVVVFDNSFLHFSLHSVYALSLIKQMITRGECCSGRKGGARIYSIKIQVMTESFVTSKVQKDVLKIFENGGFGWFLNLNHP